MTPHCVPGTRTTTTISKEYTRDDNESEVIILVFVLATICVITKQRFHIYMTFLGCII